MAEYYVLFILIFTIVPTNSELTGSLKHLSAKVGSSLNISCRTDGAGSSINWDYFTTVENRRILLYRNRDGLLGHFEQKLSVYNDRQTGLSVLVFRSVALDDAGIYRCIDTHTHSLTHVDTELVVMSADELCNTQLRQIVGLDNSAVVVNVFDISCLLFYRGNIQPSIDCQPSDGDITVRQTHSFIALRQIRQFLQTPISNITTVCRASFNASERIAPLTVVRWEHTLILADATTIPPSVENSCGENGASADSTSSTAIARSETNFETNPNGHHHLQPANSPVEYDEIRTTLTFQHMTFDGVTDTQGSVPMLQIAENVPQVGPLYVDVVADEMSSNVASRLQYVPYEKFDLHTRVVDPPPPVYARLVAS